MKYTQREWPLGTIFLVNKEERVWANRPFQRHSGERHPASIGWAGLNTHDPETAKAVADALTEAARLAEQWNNEAGD